MNPAVESSLQAGAARINITPFPGYPRSHWGGQRLPAKGALRSLYARTTYFETERSQLALISLDLCAISYSFTREIQEHVNSVVGSEVTICLNCSHSHEAPLILEPAGQHPEESYREELREKIVQTVLQARREKRPALIYFARQQVEGLNQNRRKPWLPVDRSLSVLHILDTRRQAISFFWQFTAHPLINISAEAVWDSDFPGLVNQMLETIPEVGQPQFLQGAAGDVFPFDWHFRDLDPEYPMGEESLIRMSERLTELLILLMKKARRCSDAQLDIRQTRICLPTREVPWTAEEAYARLEVARHNVENLPYEPWGSEDHITQIAQRHPDRYQFLALQNALRFAQRSKTWLPCHLSGFRVGEVFFMLIPGELFSKEGLEIVHALEGRPVWILGYSNGYLSYLPSREEFQEVYDWDLEQFIDQERNRWAYGATITTEVGLDAADRIAFASIELLKKLNADRYQKRQ